VSLKRTDLVIEIKEKTDAEERRIRVESRFNANPSAAVHQILEMKEKYADEMAMRLYQIYCEVWKAQGYEKSAAFVRAVCNRAILVGLYGRASSISKRVFNVGGARCFQSNHS
jgi:hypothetical protein